MVVCVVSGINESRIRNVDMIYILDLILTVVVKLRALHYLQSYKRGVSKQIENK